MKKIATIVAVLVASFILTANIVSSQTVSDLYTRFVNNERSATVPYLTSIKALPVFHQELIRFKNKYGGEIEREVFFVEDARKKQIAKMEEALQKNPQSRDLLYGLVVLYDDGGDSTKAREYLNQAKEVDPSIQEKFK